MSAVIKLDAVNDDQIPSLYTSCMLVYLNVSVGSFKKTDSKSARELIDQKGATTEALKAQKVLLGDCMELKEVQNYAAMVRTWNNQNTYPWKTSRGSRVLPGTYLEYYGAKVEEYRTEFYRLVGNFKGAYRNAVQAAQFSMAGFFDASDYPSESELDGLFRFDVDYDPLPHGGDFRVDLGRETNAYLREKYEEKANAQLTNILNHSWERLHQSLAVVVNQLRVKGVDGAEENGKLYESSFDAVIELCDMLEHFNVTNDPALDKMRRDLKMTMQGINVKDLKKDEAMRVDVRAELSDILGKINW